MSSVGAFEAKNNFSRLLARARRGETITITHRGAPVARLMPPEQASGQNAFAEAVERMQARTRELGGVSRQEILEWIAEGRR